MSPKELLYLEDALNHEKHMKTCLIIEGTYYLVFIFLVIFGFKHLGLIGTGIAITIAHLAELVIVYVYSRVKFGFRFSRQSLLSIMIHTPLCAICYILTFGTQSVTYWISGTALVSIITILSFRRLQNSPVPTANSKISASAPSKNTDCASNARSSSS